MWFEYFPSFLLASPLGALAVLATAILAAAVGPLRPVVLPSDDSRTSKLPVAIEPVVGVNFSPAAPWAAVMKLPLVIAVVPLFWKSVPPVMPVTWKSRCLSFAPGVTIRPEVVCLFSDGRRTGHRRPVEADGNRGRRRGAA